jgi:hypothetical protein
LYDAMRADPAGDWGSRVKAFSGKGAASFAAAKLIVKLANQRRDAFRFLTRGSSRRSFWAADHSSSSVSKMACTITPVRRPRTCLQKFFETGVVRKN